MNEFDPDSYSPFAPRQWRLAHGRSLELGPEARIAGIVNVTPDSFSDGGQFHDEKKAIAQARSVFSQGAAIVDIGGESSRPGAKPVSAKTEQARVLPVIEQLAQLDGLLLSIDTWRAETAAKALDAGAHIVNDIWGLRRDRELAALIRERRAGVIAMHTGRERDRHPDVIQDQFLYFRETLKIVDQQRIDRDQIVLDPGFGFAKNEMENIELLARFDELHELGFPIMAGTSRKRFVGHMAGREPGARDPATAATSVVARMKGAAIVRVHDVPMNKDACAVADAVLNAVRSGSFQA